MRTLQRFLAFLLLIVCDASLNAQAKTDAAPIIAVVESSLPSAAGHIRQFAFDGDADTYFASAKNPGISDYFTLIFDKPVAVKSIVVITDKLIAGALEVSADGKKFEVLTKFTDGKATAKLERKMIQAVRVMPGEMKQPLTIREFAIESDPPVAVFEYPIEFTVDVTDAPEMKEWAEKAARICEREYAMLNDELKSDGFKPRTEISMTLKKDYKGVAAAGDGKITGSATFFKTHPDDIGAMVHETAHIVQSYRTRNNPGWLVEGVADYVRFFKYEPGRIGRINADRAKYDGSCRVTAAFLAYVTDKYDKDLVKKLNKVMREGEYKEEIWKMLTKKTLQDLGDEWKTSLRK